MFSILFVLFACLTHVQWVTWVQDCRYWIKIKRGTKKSLQVTSQNSLENEFPQFRKTFHFLLSLPCSSWLKLNWSSAAASAAAEFAWRRPNCAFFFLSLFFYCTALPLIAQSLVYLPGIRPSQATRRLTTAPSTTLRASCSSSKRPRARWRSSSRRGRSNWISSYSYASSRGTPSTWVWFGGDVFFGSFVKNQHAFEQSKDLFENSVKADAMMCLCAL